MRWRPKSVVCLSYYDLFRFRADVFAALILFLQHLPLAIAIAIATGIHPLYGISCAAVSGFLASALGDSKIRLSAPNVILVGVASTIVIREGILGLSLATLLAGALLMMLGAMGLGSAIQLLPRPVTLGFSTGIAVLVASKQFPNLLGMSPHVQPHQDLWEQLTVVLHLTQIEPYGIVLAVSAFTFLTIADRGKSRYIPVGLIVVAVGALLVKLGHLPVRTVETLSGSDLVAFRGIGAGAFKLDLLGSVLSQAFAIAVLIAIDSLQALGAANRFSGERSSADGELCVQGSVNVACAFAGGLPASGVPSYTSENANLGAQTPIAGILHAVFFSVFLFSSTSLIRFIPLPVISALILSCICNMTHWRQIPEVIKGTRAEVVAWLAISILTVVADLATAIAIGMFFSIFLYIRRPREPVPPKPFGPTASPRTPPRRHRFLK
jgi:SulP family sulfate permease